MWRQSTVFRSFLLRDSPTQALAAPGRRTFFTSRNPIIKPCQRSDYVSRIPSVARERFLFSRKLRSLRFNSTKPPNNNPNPTPHLGSPEPALSLSQRLRKLSREYGWSAVGVYFALSALDFPFCFLGVRMLGTDTIGHYEHVVIDAFWKVVQIPFPNLGNQKEMEETTDPSDGPAQATAREGKLGWSGEVEAAQNLNTGADASIYTQLALAYAIHKSFIFLRVPLTAAVTPKVVKTLRGWGWNIGKRRPKSP